MPPALGSPMEQRYQSVGVVMDKYQQENPQDIRPPPTTTGVHHGGGAGDPMDGVNVSQEYEDSADMDGDGQPEGHGQGYGHR